jgi:hypothetical protein
MFMFATVLLAALLHSVPAQDQVPASADTLANRVDHLVHCVDANWVLVGASGNDEDRVHQWRRVNDIMTVQARRFDTEQQAEQHVKSTLAALSVAVDEKLKVGSFAARISWGDGRSTVYLSVGRTAVVISAPSADLARRLSRQAALEFAPAALTDQYASKRQP